MSAISQEMQPLSFTKYQFENLSQMYIKSARDQWIKTWSAFELTYNGKYMEYAVNSKVLKTCVAFIRNWMW